MLDKIANGINKNIDSKINITLSDLIKYNKINITNYKRVDEKNKNNRQKKRKKKFNSQKLINQLSI